MKTYIKDMLPTIDEGEKISEIKKIVEKNGSVILLRDNEPQYVLMRYEQYSEKDENEKLLENRDLDELIKEFGYMHYLGLKPNL